ncbi:MAG: acyl-CoA dehydrogenase family protein [Deltaproteobacteria bacterium]|nr:acyl-CoA dehydrogenase family protein [Deltaproteobacteria bacterium]
MTFFGPEHEILRQAVRRFVAQEIAPHVDRWEREESFPRELYGKWAAAGFLGAGYPEALGGTPADIFHRIAINEELVGGGSSGLAASLGVHIIALPPIVAFGTDEQKRRFVAPVLSGAKIAALAITEPDAGSDVAGLRTRATREGDEYVVHGSKMFITSGTRADFLTTAVRTGGEGAGGISILVVETARPGVSVSRKLEKLGWAASDTAEIAFDECRVPAANLIGEENAGFKVLMANFATERLFLAVMALKLADMALGAARKYAAERRAFGRPLTGFQVLRHRMAEMATRLEVARTYVYHVAAQLRDGDPCIAEAAMAKNAAVAAAMWIVDAALQIHGGYGYMRESLVERLYRDVRLFDIGGGTREMMNEIIAKQLGL